MIGLVGSMLRARFGSAFTVFLLGAGVTAAAVSASVYGAAADQAVVASEVTRASATELSIHTRRVTDPGGTRQFEVTAASTLDLPGFVTYFAVEADVYVEGSVRSSVPRLVHRDGVCAQIRIVSGRCFAAPGEVVVGDRTARVLGARVGQALPATMVAGHPTEGYMTVGDPVLLTVVGLYTPLDRNDEYWGSRPYFVPNGYDRVTDEPVLTNRLTVENTPRSEERQSVDAVAGPGAITAASVPAVRTRVNGALASLELLDADSTTDIPALLDRIDRSRALVAEIVPIAAVPLVLLCWFVLFLAVAAAAQRRRHELGLLALRGVRTPRRWWLGTGESLVPIVLGAAAGYALGHVAVRVAADLMLSRASDVPITAGATGYVAIAVVGALVAGVLAQRRELSLPAVDLIREIPPRAGRWKAAVFETVVVALAVAAAVQLRAGGDGLEGVALFAPALLVLAAGLLAARGVRPVADRVGARSLKRGRLGAALAAYALSRRPGGQRLLALLVVAVALLCFAATATDVARRARLEQVRVELGAAQVVTVAQLPRSGLLAKVRAADPEGRFAMAVAGMPKALPSEPATLAVDAGRLPAVAAWSGDAGPSVAEVAATLHPEIADPMVIRGAGIAVDLSARSYEGTQLYALVAPLDGSAGDRVYLGAVRGGRFGYEGRTTVCQESCRLAGIEVAASGNRPFAVDVTVHEIRADGTAVADRTALTGPGAWRAPLALGAGARGPSVEPDGDGLRIRHAEVSGGDFAVRVQPVDAPVPLPVVAAEGVSAFEYLSGFDGRRMDAEIAARAPVLPRLGRGGALVDLEYAERLAGDLGDATRAEVWLGPDAPPDAIDRLREQGLVIRDVRSFDALHEAMEEQGPAVALRFHGLAAGFGIVLGIGALWFVAGVERQQRSRELRSLRAQGLPRRAVAAAGRRGYLWIVLAALVVGPVVAIAGWLLAGEYFPLFVDDVALVAPPRWPTLSAVGLPWSVAGVALAAVAILAGARITRRTS